MTGKEWSDAFKKIEGREPSPQEFMEAKKAGFPELVMESSESLTAADWTALFTEIYKRTPSPQEFMAAKAQGFPAMDNLGVDEKLVLESQASSSEEAVTQLSSEPMVTEEVHSTQIVEVPEEQGGQPKSESVVTEKPQPAQAVAATEEIQEVAGVSQENHEVEAATTQALGTVELAADLVPPVNPATLTPSYVTQAAANQNPQQASTGMRILRILLMIAIVLLTIALAVVLGYFALGPLLEMLG
ncbi:MULTISPECIES: hypothetical protein [unclassified Streptococcus]|uniref:hypothetical protein n=1 Tax=unclassified Streptococcus TaxID=2608887 RepID=UPI001071AF55|nr:MULTISPECIES: hypothetical protein [unclassified Streptococcus]MBF0806715.1 hypothetical protein [Streptococcus sp. 19428wA2_WM07]TFU26465.1 hypothetical protein E4T71_07995 [Streptococcus sp. WM07]